MSGNDWERRVVNRVPENTILNTDNVLKFFDGELESYAEGCRVIHNGSELQKGVDFDLAKKEDTVFEIQIKRQLQPNDRFGIQPSAS